MKPLLEAGLVKGMAHITGGGLTENVPRVLPAGCDAVVACTWTVPPIFSLLQRLGEIDASEMYRAFNMGIGMVVICGAADADRALGLLKAAGETHAVVIGAVEAGSGVVRYRS